MTNWPRVTQILRDFGFYSEFDAPSIKSDEAKVRGGYVDAGCNLLAAGKAIDTDWFVRHPECVRYIDAYVRFLIEHNFSMHSCQQEVRSERERYYGHYDQFGLLDGRLTMLSLKSGSIPSWAGIQEALYTMALCEQKKLPRSSIMRQALQLKADGTYTLRAFTDPREYDEAILLVRAWWVRQRFVKREP